MQFRLYSRARSDGSNNGFTFFFFFFGVSRIAEKEVHMGNQHVARSNKCLIITILHLPHRVITPRNVHTAIRFRRCPMHAGRA